MSRRVRRFCVVPAVIAVTALGCGPITYVGEVTRRATDAVDAARAAQAEKYAPYWYTRATQYLHKAREVAAHADYQGANHYGRLATESANQAATEARIAAQDPSRRPREVPEARDAPAKDAPIAPARDLPAPAKDRLVPAKERLVPAKEPSTKETRTPVAPAKAPP